MPSTQRTALRFAVFIGLCTSLWLAFDHFFLHQQDHYLWFQLSLTLLLISGLYYSLGKIQKTESQLHHELLLQALKNRMLFDDAPVAMLELHNGSIVQGNRAAEALLGTNPQGQQFLRCFINSDQELVDSWLTAAAQGISSNALPHRVTLHAQHSRTATVELSMMQQDTWQNSILIALYDVTEQAAQEALLRQSEQRLELALRSSRDAPWDWQLDSNQMYYSDRWWDMLGYIPDELPADAALWKTLIHPDDIEHVQRHFSDVLKSHLERYELSFRLRHKKGHFLPVLSRGFILRDSSGQAIRICGTNSDQSKRAAFEQSLREDVRQLDAFIANLPGYVYRSKVLQPAVPEYISPGVEQLTGYSQNEYLLQQKQIHGMEIHPDDRDIVFHTIREALQKKEGYEVEYRLYDRQHKLKWVWERGRSITSDQGNHLGREGFVTDITSRKKTEQALAESEYRWKFALEGAGDGIWDWNLVRHEVYYSPRWKSMLGYENDEISNAPEEWEHRIHPEELNAVRLTITNHLAGNSPSYVCEHRLRCKNGDWKWVLDRGMVVSRDLDGNALRIIGTHSDITERKLMMQRLEQSESLLRRMGSIAKIGGWELDLQNMQISWSEETYQIHELPLWQDISLDETMQFFPPEAGEQLKTAISRCTACGQPWDLELPLTTAVGKPRWIRSQGDAIWERGQIIKLHGAFQDITEHRQIKQALQQEKTRLNAILDSAVDAIIVINQAGIIEQFNPAACRIFGYSPQEALGNNITMLLPPQQRQEHEQAIRRYLQTEAGDVIGKEHELTGLRKNGDTFPAEVSVSAWQAQQHRFFTGMVRDITERREVQAQLIQSQKMESLSMLSGGLAHDFNNLLGIITGNLDFLEPRLEGDEKALQRLQSALRATERGADITRRMLTLSRQRSSRHSNTPQHVNRLIGDVAKVLERMLGPNYQLDIHLASDAYDCDLDPAEFENVLLNLTVNARDAMPDGGNITIQTRNVHAEDTLDPKLAILDANTDYLEISFADTGCGMSGEVLQRAFEPFFSTKEAKGTGLGLAMVYSFVKHLKGQLRLDSAPGNGSAFYLYLPRASKQAQTHAQPAPSGELPRAIGEEYILVVDDEPDLLHTTSAHLQQLGYRTLVANCAADALVLLRSDSTIHLLLSDVVMPGGMFGTELAHQAQQLHPALPVLLCSGFPQKISDNPAHARFESCLIHKPFRKSELARRVRNALDEARQQEYPT